MSVNGEATGGLYYPGHASARVPPGLPISLTFNTKDLAVGRYAATITVSDPFSVMDYWAPADKTWPETSGPKRTTYTQTIRLQVGAPSICLDNTKQFILNQSQTCLVNKPAFLYDSAGNVTKSFNSSIELFAAWPGDGVKFAAPIAEQPSQDPLTAEFQGPTQFIIANLGDGPLKYHIATTYNTNLDHPNVTGWITNDTKDVTATDGTVKAASLMASRVIMYRDSTHHGSVSAETFKYTNQVDLNVETVLNKGTTSEMYIPTGTYTATLTITPDNAASAGVAAQEILVVLRVGPKAYILNSTDTSSASTGVGRDNPLKAKDPVTTNPGPVINLTAPVGESPNPSWFRVALPGLSTPGISPETSMDSDKFPTFCPNLIGNATFISKGYSATFNSNMLNYAISRGGVNSGDWMKIQRFADKSGWDVDHAK